MDFVGCAVKQGDIYEFYNTNIYFCFYAAKLVLVLFDMLIRECAFVFMYNKKSKSKRHSSHFC